MHYRDSGMKRAFRPRTRRRLSWLVALLLLWQQVAMAAYACGAVPAAVGAAAAAAATAGMAWYHGVGSDNLTSLTSAIGSSLSSQIASASTPPGSSSGGGGGGFSGGGGGGGGGGGR